MGQKINPLGLRLKKRTNWNTLFCVQNIKNYSKINTHNQQIEYSLDILLSNFHLFANNKTIIKNSKNYQIYTRLLQKKDIIRNHLEFQNSDRLELVKNEKKKIKNLFLNKYSIAYTFSDYFFNKQPRDISKITNKQLLILAPKIITTYITNQLSKKGTLKRSTFRANLNFGIMAFSYQLLKRIQNSIIGLKIICSGKWKKTKSGRKQKLTVKFGRVVNPSMSNTILYDYSAQKTKFGVCGVKVWIAHKNIYN
jgi:hypothetical protein